jgi:hypothetical protein
MRNPIVLSAASLVLLVGLSMSILLPSRDAAAQSGGAYINAVDLDIAPGQMAIFIEAIKENGAASVKEPGLPRVQHLGIGERSKPRLPV